MSARARTESKRVPQAGSAGGAIEEPSERDLNVMDAQRMLRAATILESITVMNESRYHEWACALVVDATKILEKDAKVVRF